MCTSRITDVLNIPLHRVLYVHFFIGVTKWVLVLNFIALCCFAALFMVGCDNIDIAGVTTSYHRSADQLSSLYLCLQTNMYFSFLMSHIKGAAWDYRIEESYNIIIIILFSWKYVLVDSAELLGLTYPMN